MPARLIWMLIALVLALTGWYMLVQGLAGQAGFILVGIGVGVGCAVLGSLAHDALAGPRERL